MEALPPDEADELRRDIFAMSDEISRGISPGRVVAAASTWRIWCKFCQSVLTDPGLSGVDDPVPFLILFGRRWRDGRLAPRGQPVSARTAEDAVRHVGQAFSMLGALDPRLNRHGKLDYRFSRTFKSWKTKDGPSQRKRPVPRQVLLELTRLARAIPTQQNLAAVDLIWLGYFFLLRPSEYLHTAKGLHPFRLCDVLFRCAGREFTGDSIDRV